MTASGGGVYATSRPVEKGERYVEALLCNFCDIGMPEREMVPSCIGYMDRGHGLGVPALLCCAPAGYRARTAASGPPEERRGCVSGRPSTWSVLFRPRSLAPPPSNLTRPKAAQIIPSHPGPCKPDTRTSPGTLATAPAPPPAPTLAHPLLGESCSLPAFDYVGVVGRTSPCWNTLAFGVAALALRECLPDRA